MENLLLRDGSEGDGVRGAGGGTRPEDRLQTNARLEAGAGRLSHSEASSPILCHVL